MNRTQKGRFYEEQAACFLIGKGYRIVERNYQRRGGEIDIIAEDGEYLCFVEVKYRASAAGGFPQEAVTRTKQLRIARTAAMYLSEKRYSRRQCRFDVVAIDPDGQKLIRNAFGGM